MKHLLPRWAALGLALLPSLLLAQNQGFDVNKLYGKNFTQVSQMLGKPSQTSGNPIGFAEFNPPGTIFVQVWFAKMGPVTRVQFMSLAEGETKDQFLKRFHMTLPSDARKYYLKAPAYAMQARPTSGPWSTIFLAYEPPKPFQTAALKWAKGQNRNPYTTMFWVVQLRTPRMGGSHHREAKKSTTGSNVVSAGG